MLATPNRPVFERHFVSLLCLGLATMTAWAAQSVERPFSREIAAGERFLTNLFEARFDLLPEYQGAKVYWLYHDNYLAAKLLKPSRPDLSLRIESAIRHFGVSHSGKIELLFGEAPDAFPFRTYQLLDVTNVAGKVIRTERVTTNLLKGWDAYADLLLMAAIANAKTAPDQAKGYFQKALALWDGHGFADPAFKKQRLYATYKPAVAILAANAVNQNLEFRSEMLERLRKLQSQSGGWITDYDREGQARGLANVETTCLVLMALHKAATRQPD